MYLGKVICVPDPARARARDEAFFDGSAPPPPAFPHLTDGILHSVPDSVAGLLSPHGRVRRGDTEGRFDDVVGTGFVLIGRNRQALAGLGDAVRPLNARTAMIVPMGADADPADWEDLDGKFLPFMERHGIEAMLVRPDFYLFGAVRAGEDPRALLGDCAAQLQRFGLMT